MQDTTASPIEVIDENEEVFETIAEEADDPIVAKRFGQQPLDLLALERNGGGQL